MMRIRDTRYEMITRFFKGSKRYFLSSVGFSTKYRSRVTTIYNFCRLVDDSVDEPEKCLYTLEDIRSLYHKSLSGENIDEKIISDFTQIQLNVGIEEGWVEALFDSMQMDLDQREYITLEDTLEYVYGAAEVVGLFMSKALELSDESYQSARILGRSAQWINFIRDIGEDYNNGRTYFPKDDIAMFKLKDLSFASVISNTEAYEKFMKYQLSRFHDWTEEAESGFHFIDPKHLRPIKFATDMDKWKAEKISNSIVASYSNIVNPSLINLLLNSKQLFFSTRSNSNITKQL
jgi:phytoene synthase